MERPEILFELAQAAQLLDVAKHEVINKLPELVPGFAEKLFADFGLLFGLIAAAAILCAAPHLALAAGGLLITSFLGQGWAIEREDARENLVEIFAPQLEMIRSATVRAESAYTTEYIKARVSRVAAAHYEASLALPRSNPVNGALSGTESLPQWRVTADAEKSRLCLILLGIQTGAISIPDAQGRELLCKLLDAEALAQQQGLETDFQKNEAIRQDFLRLLDFLKYRPPVMQLIREGDAGENGTWAQGSEFERLLREHEEVIIDCGEQPASTQDRIRRDTGHVKARLGLPVGTAPDAHGT
ncbi:hypothetical protein AB870_23200 (plasmid) [Pandoraea faecigallinarum]|uniref:Uncharacterized protein n=1 Tax=Pandoraea faecigallinarum TaxID=656179 RepID=A0A0H3WZK7_9BURK|nr:hypothetical protein AB870_23200 [Pandoraea faecigallinarum]